MSLREEENADVDMVEGEEGKAKCLDCNAGVSHPHLSNAWKGKPPTGMGVSPPPFVPPAFHSWSQFSPVWSRLYDGLFVSCKLPFASVGLQKVPNMHPLRDESQADALRGAYPPPPPGSAPARGSIATTSRRCSMQASP